MAEAWAELVTRWSGAGLLDQETVERIRAFESEHAGSNRLRWPIWIALVFGALTLGAGVLLFVSAHWDSLSPQARFGLVVALVAVFHVGGAFVGERSPGTAMALHLVGTVALGAGIFLAGQIFNLDEHWPGGLMLWTLGAAIAWALFKDWAQLGLTAMLAPAWLIGEWSVATENVYSGTAYRVVACGLFLLALAYFTAVRPGRNDLRRQTLTWLGGVALLPAAGLLATASFDKPWSTSALSLALQIVGWTAALGLPLMLAALLRRRAAWPNVVAMLWVLALLTLHPTSGDLPLYVWWAIGATAMAAWGVVDGRSERINMGAAIFAATVLTFYFSQVMDKLGRSASLVGLGLLFLAGGWSIERVRRRLVLQVQGGQV